jgi:alcohol dehydrogenase class IV
VRFELATAGRVLFGPGVQAEVAPLARSFGTRALVVVGRSRERAGPLAERLAAQGVTAVVFCTDGEPSVETVRQGTALGRAEGCDQVIGFGGGSAIDAAKAIAALLGNGGDPLDYLEVVGRGQAIAKPPLPFIAIPTTAGTGSEVTRNAVLASPEHKVKASLRSPLMLARAAVIDPELLAGLAPAVLAASGLDAFTQLVEPFVSVKANPLTDALCREGLRRSARSLRRAFEGDRSGPVLEDLALASLFGGLALANAGLGAVHGFAAPIGGAFDAPHGTVCAALLPIVAEANIRALVARAPTSPALERYAEIAALVTGRTDADPLAGAAWMQELSQALAIPGLRRWGVSEADLPALVAKGKAASSMKGNPIALTDTELAGVLSRAI